MADASSHSMRSHITRSFTAGFSSSKIHVCTKQVVPRHDQVFGVLDIFQIESLNPSNRATGRPFASGLGAFVGECKLRAGNSDDGRRKRNRRTNRGRGVKEVEEELLCEAAELRQEEARQVVRTG